MKYHYLSLALVVDGRAIMALNISISVGVVILKFIELPSLK